MLRLQRIPQKLNNSSSFLFLRKVVKAIEKLKTSFAYYQNTEDLRQGFEGKDLQNYLRTQPHTSILNEISQEEANNQNYMMLQQIIDLNQSEGKDSTKMDVTLIDVEKIFESIERRTLFQHDWRLKLPLGLILAQEAFYNKLNSYFLIDGQTTRRQHYNNRVMQRSSHGPVLSLLYYDIVIRYLQERNIQLGIDLHYMNFICRAWTDDFILLFCSA